MKKKKGNVTGDKKLWSFYIVGGILLLALFIYDFSLLSCSATKVVIAKGSLEDIETYSKNLPECVLNFAKFYSELHPDVTFELVKEGDRTKLYAYEGNNFWEVWRGVYIKDKGDVLETVVFFYEPYKARDYITITVDLPKRVEKPQALFLQTRPILLENVSVILRPQRVVSVKASKSSYEVKWATVTLNSEDKKISKEIAEQVRKIAKDYGLGKEGEFLILHEFFRTVLTNNGWWISENENWFKTYELTTFAFKGSKVEKIKVNVGGILEGLLLSGGEEGPLSYRKYYELYALAEVLVLKNLGFDAKMFEYTPIQDVFPNLRGLVAMNPYLVALNESDLTVDNLKSIFMEIPGVIIKLDGKTVKYALFDVVPDPDWHSIPMPSNSKAVFYTVR